MVVVDIIDRDIVEESPTKEDSEILTRDIKKKGESVLEYTVRGNPAIINMYM